MKDYKLSFLPLFEDDLNEIIDYISFELENPSAAMKLVDKVEKAINERLPYAESFEPYHSVKNRKNLYYVIPVKNL